MRNPPADTRRGACNYRGATPQGNQVSDRPEPRVIVIHYAQTPDTCKN
jgi:hypothetical protein